jgi:hypothetical protein
MKRFKDLRRALRIDRTAGFELTFDLGLIQDGLKVSLLLARLRRKAPRWESLKRK